MKVAAVAVGALIVFMVVGTIVHLLMDVVFAAIVIGAIAIAIKVAAGRRKLPRAERTHREYEIREPRQAPTVIATPPAAHNHADVEDELARLKREMGAP